MDGNVAPPNPSVVPEMVVDVVVVNTKRDFSLRRWHCCMFSFLFGLVAGETPDYRVRADTIYGGSITVS